MNTASHLVHLSGGDAYFGPTSRGAIGDTAARADFSNQ